MSSVKVPIDHIVLIDTYLTTKRKEACDEFDTFLKVELTEVDRMKPLAKDVITNIFKSVQGTLVALFIEDCKFFKGISYDTYVSHPYKDTMDTISQRQLKKIQEFVENKLALLLNRTEFEERGSIKRTAVEELLAKNAL